MDRHIFDQCGDIVSTFSYDASEDKITHAQWQDVTPIIEINKRLQRQDNGYSKSGDLRRVASVPLVVLMDWLRKDGISVRAYLQKPRAYNQWLRQKLYDPDNRYFLTAPRAK